VALERGYVSNRWYTFNQAKAAGAHVRKGEQGSMVVYAGRLDVADNTEAAAEAMQLKKPGAMFLRAYTVFNVEQLDGLAPDAPIEPMPEEPHDPRVDAFFDGIGALVVHGGDRAFYMLDADVVQLPSPGAFTSAAAYCATKAHELVHWTGHPQRLAREFGQRFGDAAYAFEELVAELGAAFVCADLGLAADVRDDHAAYLASWLLVLKSDKHAIFTAATQAQRAADFLHKRQESASA
jgi:antirestriction protein ArdC